MRFVKKVLVLFLPVGFALGLSGCFPVPDGAQFPKPTPGFAPVTQFHSPKRVVYRAVLRAFAIHQVTAASANPSTGVIVSHWMAGPGTMGLINSYSRYRFLVTVLGRRAGGTRIYVRTSIEDGGVQHNDWRSVSAFNKGEIRKASDWMIENIDKVMGVA
jgi:hypothetical protein